MTLSHLMLCQPSQFEFPSLFFHYLKKFFPQLDFISWTCLIRFAADMQNISDDLFPFRGASCCGGGGLVIIASANTFSATQCNYSCFLPFQRCSRCDTATGKVNDCSTLTIEASACRASSLLAIARLINHCILQCITDSPKCMHTSSEQGKFQLYSKWSSSAPLSSLKQAHD